MADRCRIGTTSTYKLQSNKLHCWGHKFSSTLVTGFTEQTIVPKKSAGNDIILARHKIAADQNNNSKSKYSLS